VTEDELVEIDLQVLGRDTVVGALQPSLEVGERAMRAWQQPVAIRVASALSMRLGIEAGARSRL